VSALDPKTGKVTGVIEAGKSLENIAVGLNSVWATDGESGEVLRMEPN
jgi:hypothetical protein